MASEQLAAPRKACEKQDWQHQNYRQALTERTGHATSRMRARSAAVNKGFDDGS
jgi:hypothetical protein